MTTSEGVRNDREREERGIMNKYARQARANEECSLRLRSSCILIAILVSIILTPASVAEADEDTPVQGSFTVAPIISAIQVSHITTSAATVSWKTDVLATSQVFYDTEFHEDIADYTYHTDEDTALVTEHSLRLTGLSSGTKYHFRVRSVMGSIEAISHDYTFTTSTPAPPPAGGGGGGAPPTYYSNINLFGETSKWRISYEGRLLETVDITSKDGKTNIHIPKDTFCLDKKGKTLKEITIAGGEAPETPEGYLLLSKTFDLGPDGATFDPYLRLTLAYEEENIPERVEEGELYISYYSSEWVPLKSVVDAQGNKVSTDLTHLTIFAIMAKLPPPPPPAKFVLSNLEVNPAEVEPGEEVTVTIEVKNIGGREGSHTVNLLINNVLEETREVTFAPKAVKTVVFTVTGDEPGSYSVAVDGLSGSFTVAVAPPAKPINWRLISGVIAAVVAGLLIYFLAFRRRRQ